MPVVLQEEQRQISSRMSNMMGTNQEAGFEGSTPNGETTIDSPVQNHLQKAKKM